MVSFKDEPEKHQFSFLYDCFEMTLYLKTLFEFSKVHMWQQYKEKKTEFSSVLFAL